MTKRNNSYLPKRLRTKTIDYSQTKEMEKKLRKLTEKRDKTRYTFMQNKEEDIFNSFVEESKKENTYCGIIADSNNHLPSISNKLKTVALRKQNHPDLNEEKLRGLYYNWKYEHPIDYSSKQAKIHW